jgi:hypothetical protein
MGAMLDEEEENWREKEESLEFAVLEATTDVERVKHSYANFCMGRR